MWEKTYQRGLIRFRYQARSDRGLVRINNEDAIVANPEDGLFGVCDGMGGHAAGEVASSIASATLSERLKQASRFPPEELILGLQLSNERIFSDQSHHPEHGEMGTTVTLLWLLPNKAGEAWVGHVGDSRLYVQRGMTLRQLTEDHSPVFRLYKEGVITKKQMQYHPQKNLLDRYLGMFPSTSPDVFSIELRQGDRVLICTDGLTNALPEEQIQDIVTKCSRHESIVEQLIAETNTKGGFDNTSVILLEILEVNQS